MAAKRKGFTRRLIKRNALGQFARVAGSARKANNRRRNRALGRTLLRGAKRRIRRERMGNAARRGMSLARGSAGAMRSAHKARKAKRLNDSFMNYALHGTPPKVIRRRGRKLRRGRNL